MVQDTPPFQDAFTHQIWDYYLKYMIYKRYAPDTIIIKTRSEVKVTVNRKWYVTLRHPKMHIHTKFGIPTSKNQSSRKRRITRIGTHVFSLGRMFIARQEFRVRMFFQSARAKNPVADR